MIVVAIIAIIAVIAIPNLLESQKLSNETSAVASMRTIATAQQQFHTLRLKTSNNRPEFGTFAELNSHEMIDAAFLNSYKSGYNFTMSLMNNNTIFTVHASPVSEADGERLYFVNNSGRVTYSVPESSSRQPMGPAGLPIASGLPDANSAGVE